MHHFKRNRIKWLIKDFNYKHILYQDKVLQRKGNGNTKSRRRRNNVKILTVKEELIHGISKRMLESNNHYNS